MLGFYAYQHQAGAVVLYIIGEDAGVGRTSASQAAVEEVRIISQAGAAVNAVLVGGTYAGIGPGEHNRDIVVLRDAAHEGAGEAAADDIGTSFQHGQRANHGV